MSVELKELDNGRLLEVHLTGKLVKEDYETLWEDIKFDVKHFNDIERLAITGENKWEKGMAAFCKPFTTAKVLLRSHPCR
jgi:hypothetical protein